MSNRKCSVPGCTNNSGTKEILHKFPNPDRQKKLFNTWVYAIGGDVPQLENSNIFKYRRVCHLHFEEKYWCRNNRLSNIAVPTKHMPDLSFEKFGSQTTNIRSMRTSEASTSRGVFYSKRLSTAIKYVHIFSSTVLQTGLAFSSLKLRIEIKKMVILQTGTEIAGILTAYSNRFQDEDIYEGF